DRGGTEQADMEKWRTAGGYLAWRCRLSFKLYHRRPCPVAAGPPWERPGDELDQRWGVWGHTVIGGQAFRYRTSTIRRVSPSPIETPNGAGPNKWRGKG